MLGNAFTGSLVKLSLDGTRLDADTLAAITGAVVDQHLNLPTSCVITLQALDYAGNTPAGRLQLGTGMSVQLGEDEARPVFSGEVAALEVDLTEAGREIRITGYDAMFKLTFGTKARVFENLTDGAMIAEVIKGAGLQPDVDATTARYPYTLQDNVSDYAFIQSRAALLGFEIFADGRKVTVRAPRRDGRAAATLEYPVSLTEARIRMRALPQGSSVMRTGWNPKAKAIVTATVSQGEPADLMGGSRTGYAASARLGNAATAAADAGIADDEGAHVHALGAYRRGLGGFITGTATCSGDPKLKPGMTVTLAQVDAPFSGLYYIVGARHAYDAAGGYTTRLDIQRTGI